jgi:putative peptidoglycan lipid II flippase
MPFSTASLARKSAVVTAATLFSRMLGFLRDAVMAAVLGSGDAAQAFVAAFQLPNLARRLLVEGGLNGAFVPLYWEARNGPDGARQARLFLQHVLAWVMWISLALALIAAVLMPTLIDLVAPGFDPSDDRRELAIAYGRLSVFYLVFAGAVAVMAATLNARGAVTLVAWLPILFNSALLAVLVFIWATGPMARSDAGAVLSVGVLVAGALQLILISIGFARMPERAHLRARMRFDPRVKLFGARVGPALLLGGLPQLKLMVAVAAASALPGAVAWLWYANRLVELPLGLVGAVVAAVLVPALAARGQTQDANLLHARALVVTLGLACPAAAGLAAVAPLAVSVLFERGAFSAIDSAATAAALTMLALGLPGAALEKLLAARAFAAGDMRGPLLCGLAGLAVALAGSFAVASSLGLVGIAMMISLSGWVGALLLAAHEFRCGRLVLTGRDARALAVIVLATIVLALGTSAAVMALAPYLTGTFARLVALTGLIGCGLAGYGLAVQVTGALDVRGMLRGLCHAREADPDLA